MVSSLCLRYFFDILVFFLLLAAIELDIFQRLLFESSLISNDHLLITERRQWNNQLLVLIIANHYMLLTQILLHGLINLEAIYGWKSVGGEI